MGRTRHVSDDVTSGHFAIARLLLERGAKPDVSGGKNYDTLFHYALGFRDTRFVKAMFEYRADVETRNHWGLTPLHVAVDGGELDKVKLQLAFRADLNATTADEATPHFFAVADGHREVTDYLLAQGRGINTVPPLMTVVTR